MKEMLPIFGEPTLAPPDARGRFGAYGGRFVPETLIPALDDLERAGRRRGRMPAFQAELSLLLETYVGRPTPLFRADRLAHALGLGRASTSSARTSSTPARTRSTTRSGRPCSRGAWGRSGHRGDRRRAARRGHRDGRARCSGWMHRLHGRGGRAAAGAQRGRMKLLGAECAPSRRARGR